MGKNGIFKAQEQLIYELSVEGGKCELSIEQAIASIIELI